MNKNDQKMVEEHVKWFVHNELYPGSSKKCRQLGAGLYSLVDIEEDFLDKRNNSESRGYEFKKHIKYPVIYLTACAANVKTIYVHVKSPLETGECKDGLWLLELKFNAGLAISWYLDLGCASIKWTATCVASSHKLTVKGTGYLIRCGLGIKRLPMKKSDLELLCGNTYSGVVRGVKNANLLSGLYTGLWGQATIPGGGLTGTRAWQSYDGPSLAFWPRTFWSLKGVYVSVEKGTLPTALKDTAIALLSDKPGKNLTDLIDIKELAGPTFMLSGVYIILMEAVPQLPSNR